MADEQQPEVKKPRFSFTLLNVKFTPIKTNVILTAGMATGLLVAAYSLPSAASTAGDNVVSQSAAIALKDVLLLVSGGLLTLAGIMATDPPPNPFKMYLNYRLEKARLKKARSK